MVKPFARLGLAVALSLLLSASAQAQTTIGAGGLAGLTLDAAGTAYLAWNGPRPDPTPLHFCRLPRGASECAGGVKTIATSGTGESRPFLKVDGSRVVVIQQRYGDGVAGFSGVYAYTSTDSGDTFAAGKLVGKHRLSEAIPGPGDTMSLVTHSGGWFQNVPTDGSAPVSQDGTSTTGAAQLFADEWHLAGAIGMIDGATPLAMFMKNGGESLRYRRYSGSGPINADSNWTAPVQLTAGTLNFKFASGPAGLFMISVDHLYRVLSRRWAGTEFGEPVLIDDGASDHTLHASQDEGGRVHVTYGKGTDVRHAVSDDGASWRSGTVYKIQTLEEGGFGNPRIAAAPDHGGLIAWDGAGTIRIARTGPDAPVAPAPPPPAPAPPPGPAAPPAPTVTKPVGRLTATGTAKAKSRVIAIRVTLKLVLPKGMTSAAGCSGKVTLSLLKGGKKVIGVRSGKISARTCKATLSGTLKKSALGGSRLKLKGRFAGNAALAPSVRNLGTMKVKG